MASFDLAASRFAVTLTSERVEDILTTDGVAVHRAYGEKCHFDQAQSRYIPGPETATNKLETLLELYVRPYKQAIPSVGYEFDAKNCSWDAVLDQLEKAKIEHGIKDKKRSRKSAKSFADAVPYAEKYIDMLPEDFGLRILKGGLAVIFSAARQKVENRERILQVFEEIPDMIHTICVACNLFGSDQEERLPEKAKLFFDQLSQDVGDLIDILLGKDIKIRRVLKSLQLGVPDTKQIDQVLRRITKATKEWQSTMDRISMKHDAASREDMDSIRHGVEMTGKGLGLVYNEVREMPKIRDMEQLGNQIVDEIRREIRNEMRLEYQHFHRQGAASIAADVKTMLLGQLLRDNTALLDPNVHLHMQLLASTNHQISRQPSPSPAPLLSRFDLLCLLNVDPQIATHDLRAVVRHANRMSPNDQARARYLLRRPAFQRWSTPYQHALLLADGSFDGIDAISPLSVLVATIAVSLLDVSTAVAIHFFCGRHLDPDAEDGMSGPRGMLRSLISQLILGFEAPLPNLAFINSPDFLRNCHNHTLPALCHIFQQLVNQLPPNFTVFCLIDGITWYERNEWLDEVQNIVDLFQTMANDMAHGPRWKALMTSPNRSTEIREQVDFESQYVCLSSAGSFDYTSPLASPAIMDRLSHDW